MKVLANTSVVSKPVARYKWTTPTHCTLQLTKRYMSIILFFFKNLSSKNLTIKPNYVKQYQPSKDYYKIWVMSLRNWLLRQIKWHFIKSQPYGIKRTVRKLEQDSKQNTLIYLPSCPKSHEITESERERFKSREYESGSFNFLI